MAAAYPMVSVCPGCPLVALSRHAQCAGECPEQSGHDSKGPLCRLMTHSGHPGTDSTGLTLVVNLPPKVASGVDKRLAMKKIVLASLASVVTLAFWASAFAETQ
jgi:hypothetical protein